MKGKVSQRLKDEIEAIRANGHTNMLDYDMVQRIAFEMKYYDTVIWLQENKLIYHKVLMGGFEIET